MWVTGIPLNTWHMFADAVNYCVERFREDRETEPRFVVEAASEIGWGQFGSGGVFIPILIFT